MPSADRSTILQQMTSLRSIAAIRPSDLHEQSALPYWRLFMSPEARILEIVELAAILRTDGYLEGEVFARLRKVHGITDGLKTASDPLDVSVSDYLRAYYPTYLDFGEETRRSALSLAKTWAETSANNKAASRWPPSEMLGERVAGGLRMLEGYQKGPLGRDARRLRARSNAGDELRRYSTDAVMWTLMMGSGGYALVREGRSLDHIQTRMN